MKKIYAVTATVTLCAWFLCAAAFAAEGKKVLGVAMPNATHGFTGESIKHAQYAVIELSKAENFDYRLLTSGTSVDQIKQVDSLIAEKVDCIVLWPHNGDDLRDAAERVMEAKIPLVIYDRLIDNFKPTAEVTGDHVTLGDMAGRYLNKYFASDLKKGKVNILEFMGDNSSSSELRSQGFQNTADKNFNIVKRFHTNWQRYKALEEMQDFLEHSSVEEVESIKAVFTHDDEVVLGVLDAISSYNGEAKINIRLVTGVGGRRENVETFDSVQKTLHIDQVTYLFSPGMVRDAIKIGADILAGRPFSSLYLIPIVEIDNSSYKEYMKSDAWKLRYETHIGIPGA